MGLLNAIGLGKNSFTAKQTYNPYEKNKASLGGFEDYISKQQTFDPTGGQQAEVRGQQQGLGQRFEDVLAGRGPSVAEQQMRMGQEEALKGAAALGATQSARGAGYGGIARGLMQQGAQASQDVAQKAAMLRAQEQQAAMGQYGQFLGQTRGQDLQAEQMSMQDEQAKNQMKQQLLAMGMNIEQAEAQAQAQVEQQRLEAQSKKRGLFGKILGGAARLGAGILTGGASEVGLAGLKGMKAISGGGGSSAGPAATPMPASAPYVGSGPTMYA
jgi:hypothetical protein